MIYISNPSRFPAFPEDFQGDSARAQYLSDAMSRMYFMAQDSLAVSDEQYNRYFQELRDFAYTSLHHVGESRRLAFRPPHVPQEIPLYVDQCRVQRAPRNTQESQHGGGRRRRL